MDEKKVREAIEVIKANYPTSGYYMLRESLDIAIEALQKQLPKKVDVWANGTEHCPVCDKNITYTGLHVCPVANDLISRNKH